MNHEDDDGCGVYDCEDELRVLGFDNPVIADDIEVGDFVQNPKWATGPTWFEVQDTWSEPGSRSVHILLVEATKADLHQAWTDIHAERTAERSPL
jgi:hypothetical protein